MKKAKLKPENMVKINGYTIWYAQTRLILQHHSLQDMYPQHSIVCVCSCSSVCHTAGRCSIYQQLVLFMFLWQTTECMFLGNENL